MRTRLIDFYRDSQAAIEEEYLEYYPEFRQRTHKFYLRPKKTSPKDGFIERPIHGGMHVGRASLWVVVLHQLFKENFPTYVRDALQSLNDTFGLDEMDVIDLTRLAAIYHDSARLDEGRDFWDKQSAEKLKKKLETKGVESKVREFFEQASGNKDRPDDFESHFKVLGMSQSAHYVRKLINLADCIDIIRCCGEFQFNEILDRLKDIPEYRADPKKHHQTFVDLVLNVHRVIYLQGDMLFNCHIIMPDGSKLNTEYQGDHLIMARKVLFEHAPNVVSALAADMMQSTPYFSRFFQNEPLLCTDLATVEPPFDAFVHGTQSSMLIMLEKSGFELDSPIGMLRKQCAALTGELYDSCLATSINSSPMMCFGKLHSWQGYMLDKVVERYTAREATRSSPESHRNKAIQLFHKNLKKCREDSYASINPMLIYYMRARYFGASDKELTDPQALYNEYKTAIDVYYLLLLIAEHLDIDTDYNVEEQVGGGPRFCNNHFKFQVFHERIQLLKLDLKDIHQNPTPENLSKLLPLFPVPNHTGETTSSFVKVLDKPRDLSQVESDYDFFRVTMQNEFSFRIYYFFCRWHKINCFTGYEPAKKHIQLMEDHLGIVKGVTNCKPDNILDNPQHQDLLDRNFPLVLVSEQADAMRLHSSNYGKEYRAKRPLKFGVDVTMVATDTREHATILKKWLDQHKLGRVRVVLIDQLRSVKDTSSRPKMPYQHHDGFSRLAWIAADKVTHEDKARLKALRDDLNSQLCEEASKRCELSDKEFELHLQKNAKMDDLSDQLSLIEEAERYKSGLLPSAFLTHGL